MLVARRLKALAQDTGIVARINGDEFAMVYYNIFSLKEVAKKVESIMNVVKQKFNIGVIAESYSFKSKNIISV